MLQNYDDITSAAEFERLRLSDDSTKQSRATHAHAAIEIWLGVINQFPELKKWVAHNKTVPLEILRILAQDQSSQVRRVVAEKRKLDRALFELLANDADEVVRRRLAANAKCPQDIRAQLEAAFHE